MKNISQKSVPYKVLQNIQGNGLLKAGDKVVVALSGGPDSVCLLNVLLKLKAKLKINVLACHYNHRLRGKDSYNDEVFVKNICRERGIECIFDSAPKENLYKNEESARLARYGFFEKILGERRGLKIAIAHNSNDLAETFLLRLFRGTGILGLLSIPLSREKFIRPLLTVSRKEIEEYLKGKGLKYQVDKTNKDIKISRNFIRLKLLPLVLKKVNPNLVETLSNSAKIFEDDYSLLLQLAEQEYKNILIKESEKCLILDRKKWLMLHPSLQRSVLRMAISKISELTDLTNKQILEVAQVITKGVGKKHKLLPHSLRIELVSGKIIMSKKISDHKTEIIK